jgi:DNA-binding response OmpR family regulator
MRKSSYALRLQKRIDEVDELLDAVAVLCEKEIRVDILQVRQCADKLLRTVPRIHQTGIRSKMICIGVLEPEKDAKRIVITPQIRSYVLTQLGGPESGPRFTLISRLIRHPHKTYRYPILCKLLWPDRKHLHNTGITNPPGKLRTLVQQSNRSYMSRFGRIVSVRKKGYRFEPREI